MKDWKRTLITPDAPMLEAVRIIDESAMQIALVVDSDNVLLGTITDGDVRRALLEKHSLETPVREFMWQKPIVAKSTDEEKQVLTLMQRNDLLQVPVLDEQGRVVGLHSLKELFAPKCHDNIVMLMAGGLGTRLRPLTEDCPKPLLEVGGKPILETIVMNFIAHGFNKFYISVNYKAEMIKEHFGDGSRWGAEITYIEENKRMGTAGALGLLPVRPTKPFFVMNGDLLTKVNFRQLMDFHNEHEGLATMCVREYELQVPFGVVHTDGHKLTGIDEKPTHQFFVNAGIYVLAPEAVDFVQKDKFYDMPELYGEIVESGQHANCFPIREYWLDIGRLDDFHRAETEYATQFCTTIE